MSIDIKGKNAKLWISTAKTRDGREFPTYTISIGKKNKDGSYVNMYLKTKFSKDVFIPAEVSNGATMDFDGFLSVDSYTNKDGEEVKSPLVVIMDAKFSGLIETDDFQQAEEDIPF